MPDKNSKTIDDMLQEALSTTLETKLTEMLDEAIDKAIREALENSFRWGKMNKAIRDKVDELLVPAVEHYDLSNYNVKMGLFFEQLMADTTVDDTRKLLSTYSQLLRDEPKDAIYATELLDAFAKHCALNFDCSGREADAESETYSDFSVEARLSSENSWYSSTSEDAVLRFTIIDEYAGNCPEENHKLETKIRLWRAQGDEKNTWQPLTLRDYKLSDITHMSRFDILLTKMSQNRIRVIDDLNDDNREISVTPEQKPEWTLE